MININPYTLYNLDYKIFLSQIENESIDLIVTDPPYSSLERYRATGTTTRLKKWFPVIPNDSFPELFKQFYRILKPNSHFYMFSDSETMFITKPMAEQSGFRFWKPLVIDTKSCGMGYHYRARAQFIMFFEKGKRKLNSLSITDIIEAKRIRGKYPTEKPVTVSEILIKQSSNEGDIILDPFMGSGSVGEAALLNNRKFIGNDLSEKAFQISLERLSNLGK